MLLESEILRQGLTMFFESVADSDQRRTMMTVEIALRPCVEDIERRFMNQTIPNLDEAAVKYRKLVAKGKHDELSEYTKDWTLNDFYVLAKHAVAQAQSKVL